MADRVLGVDVVRANLWQIGSCGSMWSGLTGVYLDTCQYLYINMKTLFTS